jgi:hypothetical protein
MSVSGRLAVFLLAMVPAAWGLCPCWLAGALAAPDRAQEIAIEAPSCCPKCRHERESRAPAPRAPTAPRAPEDPPKPCESCALMDAGFGTLPSQAVPGLPPAEFAAYAAPVPPVLEAWQEADDVPVVATGPPFVDRCLRSVVLLI